MNILFSITGLDGFGVKQVGMALLSFLLAYLAIKKKYEPRAFSAASIPG
jgi:Na+-transporting methylmalonyl-CoA/oxaloacetate decarboxylase beta subunit